MSANWGGTEEVTSGQLPEKTKPAAGEYNGEGKDAKVLEEERGPGKRLGLKN